MPRPKSRYGAVAQALHWATAPFVLVTFIYGSGGAEQRVYSHARDFDRQFHETLGLCDRSDDLRGKLALSDAFRLRLAR